MWPSSDHERAQRDDPRANDAPGLNFPNNLKGGGSIMGRKCIHPQHDCKSEDCVCQIYQRIITPIPQTTLKQS